MTTPIGPRGTPDFASFAQTLQRATESPKPGVESRFAEQLREVVAEANQTQTVAETQATDYASGKNNDLHGTMIDMAKADISLRLVANVRNRVIEAYREVMRMGS